MASLRQLRQRQYVDCVICVKPSSVGPRLFSFPFSDFRRILNDSHHRILSTHLNDASVDDIMTRDVVSNATLYDVGVGDVLPRRTVSSVTVDYFDAVSTLTFINVGLVSIL